MQIYDKRLDEIKLYENNPRHNDNAVDAVVNSIREFGFKVPLVVDSEGVIVAGHTRYKAAQKLGLQKVPCIVADDLTDEQVKAFRLADNKLKVELDNIGEIDLSGMGFDLTLHDEYTDEPTQSIDGGGEININNFSDDKFSCTCPQCGFKFNINNFSDDKFSCTCPQCGFKFNPKEN